MADEIGIYPVGPSSSNEPPEWGIHSVKHLGSLLRIKKVREMYFSLNLKAIKCIEFEIDWKKQQHLFGDVHSYKNVIYPE